MLQEISDLGLKSREPGEILARYVARGEVAGTEGTLYADGVSGEQNRIERDELHPVLALVGQHDVRSHRIEQSQGYIRVEYDVRVNVNVGVLHLQAVAPDSDRECGLVADGDGAGD